MLFRFPTRNEHHMLWCVPVQGGHGSSWQRSPTDSWSNSPDLLDHSLPTNRPRWSVYPIYPTQERQFWMIQIPCSYCLTWSTSSSRTGRRLNGHFQTYRKLVGWACARAVGSGWWETTRNCTTSSTMDHEPWFSCQILPAKMTSRIEMNESEAYFSSKLSGFVRSPLARPFTKPKHLKKLGKFQIQIDLSQRTVCPNWQLIAI